MSAEWFEGEAWHEDDEAFLAELRACADDRGLLDATPDDTTLHAWGGRTSILLVDVPDLQLHPAKPVLEVIVDLERDILDCGWEPRGWLTESATARDLTGVERTPQALARRAFGWFQEQLRRPVEQPAWKTWRGDRSLVRLGDTGEVVDRQAFWRIPRRAPDRVVRLR